jgi:hypothetical protein
VPGSPRSSAIAALAAAVVLVAVAAPSAHRRDEYLQAARIAVDPERVRIELDLTAGIDVADAVIAGIDRDRDGAIGPAEAQAYVAVVGDAIRLDVDDRPLALELIESTVPDVAAMRTGEAPIRLAWASRLPPLAAGPHQLRYRNAHRAEIGVYLANALVPSSDRIAITGQRRDIAQRELNIDYELRRSGAGSGLVLFLASGGIAVATFAALAWRRRRRRAAAARRE